MEQGASHGGAGDAPTGVPPGLRGTAAWCAANGALGRRGPQARHTVRISARPAPPPRARRRGQRRLTPLQRTNTASPISRVLNTRSPVAAMSGVRAPAFQCLTDGRLQCVRLARQFERVPQKQATLMIVPTGFAIPRPAMSGAEPWIGS